MTKEQAFNNLSLPADADIETIRMRFAARYTQSDTQYDRTLTDGMKTVHEQHLRELEQAYKVATDNPVIADMGALLSLGKGYVEENEESIGANDTITTDEALAFFALYPYDTPVLAEQRYTQYVTELEEAIEQVGLEASKEPYRQEITRAEGSLQVAINYLLASQMLASQQEAAVGAAEDQEFLSKPGTEDTAEPVYTALAASKPVNKRKYAFVVAAAVALFAIGIWIGRGSGTDGDDNGKPDENVTAHAEAEITQSSAQNAARGSAQPKIAETPTAVSQQTEEEPATQQPDISPKTTVESLLKQHAPGYKITVSDAQILLEGKQSYRLPIRNIDKIDDQGAFVSVFGSSLYVDDKPKKTSEGLTLSGIPQGDREHLMSEIRKIAPARKPAETTTASPATKPTTTPAQKEIAAPETESESEQTAPPAPKKEATEPSNKPVEESKMITYITVVV